MIEVIPEYVLTVALDIASEVQLELPGDTRVVGRRKAQQRLFESAVAGDVIITEQYVQDGRRFVAIVVYNRSQYDHARRES